MTAPPRNDLPIVDLLDGLKVWLEKVNGPLVGREQVVPRLIEELSAARDALRAIAEGAPDAKEKVATLLKRWGGYGPGEIAPTQPEETPAEPARRRRR